MSLCGFCPRVLTIDGELRQPNHADTTVRVASGCEFPICTDCLMDFHESLYNDWLAHQQQDDTTAAVEYMLEDF